MDMLALIWCGIIAFGVIMYVLLGGFDLGIGILSLFNQNESQRDLMISTILPVWDGNQTWLVFGGAALYGAFPLAFSTILPLMYLPILMMVLALLFRGIAFEFRLKAVKTKKIWEISFFLGSLFATVSQGILLGTFVQGFNVDSPPLLSDWLNPFSLFCAAALICGYCLLGADYLIIKTTGVLQKKCLNIAKNLQYLVLINFIIVSIWSPYLSESIRLRWFNPSNMPYLAILPIITLILFFEHVRCLKNKIEKRPFILVIGMFLMCYFGFMISVYPYIVPRTISYVAAAADAATLKFMLIGACVMLPPLLFYTYYSYKIFSGKITEKISY